MWCPTFSILFRTNITHTTIQTPVSSEPLNTESRQVLEDALIDEALAASVTYCPEQNRASDDRNAEENGVSVVVRVH
jgi:hypothetical protein